MKRALIISDNLELVKYFKLIALGISSDIACFEYRYSSVNSNPKELISIGMSKVNVSDEAELEEIILNFDLVFSLHCKQIFPPALVENVTCINVHPGMNPHNRGWYPQVFSILNKKPIGCTIHLMDAEVDHGEILFQQEVFINEWDTSIDVYNRVVDAEKKLLEAKLLSILELDYESHPASSSGNYNSLQDFNRLCHLDLNQKGTLGDHLNLLRALTHGEFRNAYFVDKAGKKVFVKINLTPEEN